MTSSVVIYLTVLSSPKNFSIVDMVCTLSTQWASFTISDIHQYFLIWNVFYCVVKKTGSYSLKSDLRQ